MNRLAIIETHPIQYHAPVYRTLAQEFDTAVSVIYGSDFSVAGYHDTEFRTAFQWDTDLVSGYDARFLSRVAEGGARSAEQVSARGLAAQLRAVSPDAVMLVGYSPRFHRDAFLSAWRGGYPLLFRGETTDHAVARVPLKRMARDGMLRAFYGRIRALLYVGVRSREHFLRLGVPSNRLFFSPYCVDTTPFQCDEQARPPLRAATRAKLNIGVDDEVILYTGKLSPRKAPERIVRAVKEFAEPARNRTVLLFVGDGNLRDALAAQATEMQVRTRFVGFQNQTQLSRFYHCSDVLVLPSRASETWGLVVNEALHHGVPCIVSDRVGCAPDLVMADKTGEMFQTDEDEAGNAERLCGALERVLALKNDAALRARCRGRAEMYSMRDAAQGMAHALEYALEQRPAIKHP